MKTIVILTIALACVAPLAQAQLFSVPCTITIASGQSLSTAYLAGGTVDNTGACSTTPATSLSRIGIPLQVFPPAALDATSYGLLIYSCTDVAGTTCLPGQDSAGNALLIPLKGGTAPTSYVQLDPGVMAGGRTYKFQVVTSSGAAVAQTSARTFTLMVRPL